MEQLDVEPYIVKDLMLVGAACTKWLDARGLNTQTYRERVTSEFARKIKWKALRAAKRHFDSECKIWDEEEEAD